MVAGFLTWLILVQYYGKAVSPNGFVIFCIYLSLIICITFVGAQIAAAWSLPRTGRRRQQMAYKSTKWVQEKFSIEICYCNYCQLPYMFRAISCMITRFVVMNWFLLQWSDKFTTSKQVFYSFSRQIGFIYYLNSQFYSGILTFLFNFFRSSAIVTLWLMHGT